MPATEKSKRVINKEWYQRSFLELCEREKYTNLVPLDERAQVFTFATWSAPLGGLWGIMYFITDTGKGHQCRHMYFTEDDALGVVTRLCGNRQLRRLSYKRFMDELVQRAKSENEG